MDRVSLNRIDVAVVGAANVDIGGWPFAPLVEGDSNPGKVRMSLGGVGRNIAHDMCLLGLEVGLVTTLGDDLYAHKIWASCQELGMDVSRSIQVPGGATSTYLFITGVEGDMVLAVNDMEIYSCLTPAFLQEREAFLSAAHLVVADANIPGESLAWLAACCKAPLFVDPVSTIKAEKLRPILGSIHTLKPNRLEAELLSGVAITGPESLHRAAEVLLATGLRRVFISLGGDGVYAADCHGERLHLPCLPADMASATGCGDAFMAALAWSWLEGLGLRDAARMGMGASAIALESMETINPHFTVNAMAKRAGFSMPLENGSSTTIRR